MGILRMNKVGAESAALERPVRPQPKPIEQTASASEKEAALRRAEVRASTELPEWLCDSPHCGLRFGAFIKGDIVLPELIDLVTTRAKHPRCRRIKAGITEDPAWRFFICDAHTRTNMRSHWDSGYTHMTVLTYENANWAGFCEAALIKAMRENPDVPSWKVANRSEGNDGPIRRSSHYFVYVVEDWEM